MYQALVRAVIRQSTFHRQPGLLMVGVQFSISSWQRADRKQHLHERIRAPLEGGSAGDAISARSSATVAILHSSFIGDSDALAIQRYRDTVISSDADGSNVSLGHSIVYSASAELDAECDVV